MWRWKTGSTQQLQRMYYSKMALLESRPPGGAIQPGFLSYQVGYSSTWVPRGAAFQHPWSRASNPQPFLVQFKLKEKKGKKLENLFHSIKKNQTTTKKIWLWTFPKFTTLIFLLFLMGEKNWINNSSHRCFKQKVRFFSGLGGFYRASLSKSFLIFAALLPLWATEKRPFHFPLLFLKNSFSFDHGFCCCCVGQRHCRVGVCVCVRLCVFCFSSQAGHQKKKKNDGNVCKHGKRTDRFQQLGED